MNDVPAGWYPNPNDPSTYLYWDGQAWIGTPKTIDELSGGSNSNSAPLANSDETSSKIGLFGSRKAAQSLAEEAAELKTKLTDLQTVIDKYGLGNDANRELQRQKLQNEISNLEVELSRQRSEAANLAQEIQKERNTLVDLRSSAGLQAMGLYDFENPAEESVALASELEEVRKQIKLAVSSNTATSSIGGFSFNNSAKEGEKFVKDMTGLLLRAYNAEAENCIKGAKAGNKEANVKRLDTAAAQIEKLGKMISLSIRPAYHQLRLKEIDLATRYLQAVALEKAADAERRAQLREDAKVARELEREMKKLSDNQQMLISTLEAAKNSGDQDAVARAQEKLDEVNKHIEDVNARAANRRMGHVYVISNIGAFGPDVVKIGMTRRMDPMDRVRELGDASVPFRFDTHALIWDEDAVALETRLHRKFESRRLNKINAHREFFRVTPNEVLEELKNEQAVVVSFVLEPEAAEYRASIGELDPANIQPDTTPINEDSNDEEVDA